MAKERNQKKMAFYKRLRRNGQTNEDIRKLWLAKKDKDAETAKAAEAPKPTA
ncbi:MAG: hypothetical protein PHR77_04795 [Kiritimatiellae bacterium]|nr:hypothetical protein [Kiritimatiellia bacterium]MDD5519454.1 hypothetical protein [Kiritimatiellia bacterium]